MIKYSREDLLAALRTFHEREGRVPTTRNNGGIHIRHFKAEFGSWEAAIIAAGFPTANERRTVERITRECLCCGTEIVTTETENKKFCGHSCHATVTNTGRVHREETKQKLRDFAIDNPRGFIVNHHRPDSVKTPKQPKPRQSRQISSKCPICGVVFQYQPHKKRKYCSTACARKNPNMGGYRPGAGHARHGRYNGIWCDSSWELAFVITKLDEGCVVARNKRSWVYTDHKGNTRRYFPDFVVDGVLYEIKGPERVDDRLKIAAVDEPLVYIQGKIAIRPYMDHVKTRYGVAESDLPSLYE